MKTKFLVFCIGLSLLISFNFVQAQTITTTPDPEALVQTLRQQIVELQRQIIALQSELAKLQGEPEEIEVQTRKAYEFTENLIKGARGEKVVELQDLLSLFPDVYPEGLVTGYFGPMTERAVKKFQEKYAGEILSSYGLSEGTGFVGSTTRAKLNELALESVPAPVIPVVLATPAEIEEEKKSPVFLYLAEKIGQDDAEIVAALLMGRGFSLTEEFIDEFITEYSPGYDADNDVTIIGDPEAPYYLEITKNSLDRLYGYSPELYQYAISSLRQIRGVNFGTRCGGARALYNYLGMETNTYNYIYDYKDDPLEKQPLVYGFLFIHEATHNKARGLMESGEIRKPIGRETESIAYLAHGYYAKEYDWDGQGILKPDFGMTLKEFVMRWTFSCEKEPEGYVWDWDFYVTVLEKAGFPSEDLNKLRTYLGIISVAPVFSNFQTSNIVLGSIQETWDADNLAVKITWDTDKGAKTTKFEYSLNSNLSSATVVTNGYFGGYNTHHLYDLVNLSKGKTYYYRITAVDHSGNSSFSSIRQLTIPSDAESAPFAATPAVPAGQPQFLLKWGYYGSDDGRLNNPRGIAVDASGNVYVADQDNFRIQKFTSNGVFITKWGSQGAGDGQFNNLHSIAVDTSGNVYVVDNDNFRIQKFTSNGVFITKWGSQGIGDGQFNNLFGIAVDISGNVYVTDQNNHRIQKFTSNGVFITKWGSQGAGDGQFNNPFGIAVDTSGKIYVVEIAGINRVQKFAPAVLGCTDKTATNYNSEATQDDGTCVYPDTTPPADVANFTAVDGDGQVTLSWTNPSDDDFVGTKILRKIGGYPTGVTDGTQIYDGTGVSYIDTGITNGTTHYYMAFAYDEVPNYSSRAGINATPFAPPDTTPPVISNFQPSGTTTDLTPTLSLNTDENTVCRYVSAVDQSFDVMLSTFSGVGTTYHQITLETMAAGTHTYYARCQDAAGNKNTNSASITFTITAEVADTTAPVIFNIQLSNIAETSTIITWQTNEESDSAVNYGLTDSYGSTASGGTSVTYHEVNLTNLTDGTTYHYQVKSTDDAGNQALSSDRAFTTITPEPEPALEPEPEDVCPNIEGVQETVPESKELDDEGNCVELEPEDVCPNIDGVQETIPGGMFQNDEGNCVEPEPEAVLGCIDEAATNYNSEATQDDGTCVYPDTTPPANVTNFTVIGGDGQVNLYWNNPVETDFLAIKILRKTGSYPGSMTDGIPIYTGSGTSYADTGLTNGITYYYKVFTYDEVPNHSSGVEAFATPTLPGPPPEFLLKWGSLGSSDGQFDNPRGIAVDSSGNVYVADTNNDRIQKFDSGGNFITKLGSQGSGDGQFNSPRDVAVDSSGNVYVTDNGNDRIQKLDSLGNFIAKWYLSYPLSIAVDSSGNVYVTDQFNYRVQKFDSSGAFITKWGSLGSGDGQFHFPYGIAVDSLDNVYISDYNDSRVQKFDSSGAFITKWGSLGSGDGQFDRPGDVDVDSSNNVYITDMWNHRIQKFDSYGTLLGWWGKDDIGNTGWHDPGSGRTGVYGSADGQFYSPRGIAVDSSNNFYITDRYFNFRIQKFASSQVVILEHEQQLSFIDRLLKDIQSQVAAISAVILELLK